MKEMTNAYKNFTGKSEDFEVIPADGRTAITRMLQKQSACGSVSGCDTSVSSCERGNELSGSRKGQQCSDKPQDYQFQKEDAPPWSWLKILHNHHQMHGVPSLLSVNRIRPNLINLFTTVSPLHTHTILLIITSN
jgi:hypothetical protein